MDRVSDIEAMEKLGALLDDVERGGEVTITRDGRPVARLVPETLRRLSPKEAADALRALRAEIAARGVRVTAEEIREMRDEGRR